SSLEDDAEVHRWLWKVLKTLMMIEDFMVEDFMLMRSLIEVVMESIEYKCHVTILNTLSPLGKFDGKSDEGFLVGYSVNSKAFRVYNLVTKRVEVNLHVNFLEENPMCRD
ncbi:hypothetical protein Tco_1496299, partial [Tanacetum coccineum]